MKGISMRNSLGKIVIFLLTLSMLWAEDFGYHIQVDNPHPYIKEPILLTLELNQTNPDIVLFFNFDIQKSDQYSFARLDTIEEDNHHNTRIKYLYRIYPLHDGAIDIAFHLIKKVTSDESVAYSYSGDRDNVKTLVTQDTPITLPPLHLEVNPLPKDTLLVGDFSLNYQLKNHQANAHEPLPFQVTIEGVGYPPLLDTLLPKEGNFTRFTESPLVHSQNGKHKILYPMALSHTKSFTLSPIVIKAFNPKTEKIYALKIPKQRFEIAEVITSDLVDQEENPMRLASDDWSWIGTLLGYIVVFGAGYLTAFSLKWRKKSPPLKKTPLQIKIDNCQDKKALLQLLIATDGQRFLSTIERLERAIYQGEKINLRSLKEELSN
jgi:hypothetical protein